MSEQPPSPFQQPPRRPSGQRPGGGYQPGLGTLPYPYAAAGPSPHRGRNILLALAGGCALLLIGTVIGTAVSSKPGATPAPTVTVTAAAAPAPTVTVTVTRSAAASSSSSSGLPMTFSGTGVSSSASFPIDSSAVTATYTYDCSAFGGSGNFVANLVTGVPGSPSYDSVSIANQFGSGNSQTTRVYPAQQGAHYSLEVNSDCAWSITLTSS